jgi:hypothetical protein
MANKVTAQVWSREEVWAAAAYAYRINGGYRKVNEFDADNKKTRLTNKEITSNALEDLTEVLAEDFETGKQAHQFISQRCMLKILKNRHTEFDSTMARVVEIENFTRADRYEIALVVSQIESYNQGLKDLKLQELVDRSSGHLGDEGVRVSARVEVYKVLWSEKYCTYYITGLTDSRQSVMFNYKHRLQEGNTYDIEGKIKALRSDFTQLNRVKVKNPVENQQDTDTKI